MRGPGRLLGLVIVPLIIVVGVATLFFVVFGEAERDDQVVTSEPDEITVLKLQEGDCFDDPGAPSGTDTVEILSVEAKPCDEPHDFEAFHSFDLTGEELPSEGVLTSEAGERCLEAFEPFVGVPFAESELDVNYMWPSPEGWEAGDRTVVCSLTKMNGAKLVESAEGSGM